MPSPLQLSFLGGASEIGASSTLLQVADTTILIDCGIRFHTSRALPDLDQLSGRSLDAVLVTHAHTDHTGALPVVHGAYPDTPVFMTAPTVDLVRILQRDALRQMQADERESEIPAYPERAVEGLLDATVPVRPHAPFRVGEIEVTYLPASHILGAAMIHLSTPAGNVLFTGDYGVTDQLTVPGLERPKLATDLVVTESTYGDRMHSDRKVAERRLIDRVARTLEGGGRVLIPAFAIGRAQEVVLILKRAQRDGLLPEAPIFVDGMVRSVCDVYRHHPTYVTRALSKAIRRDPHPFWSDTVHSVRGRDRKDVLDASPCVIVASSGMLSGGASAFYAAHLAPCERDAILITGYQDEESPGRALLKLANGDGPRTIRLGDREVEVRCSFETYSLSAHADRMQMVGLLESLKPKTVAVVHGDEGAKTTLKGSLSCRDVVVGEDGAQLQRFYARRSLRARKRPEELVLDDPAARRLLGARTQTPLAVDMLAWAWFGRKVGGDVRQGFVESLEATGLVQRVDGQSHLLAWVEGGEGTDTAASKVLGVLAADDNPKGRLLELCTRHGVKPQTRLQRLPGHRHRALTTIELGQELWTSGPQEAESEKIAEQLAAHELLKQLRAKEPEGAVGVPESDALGFSSRNPKGRLLELCQQRKVAAPRFEIEPAVEGFVGRVVVEGRPPWCSKVFRARTRKLVEHAACADLLDASDLSSLTQSGTSSAASPTSGASPGNDPRTRLNDMRQAGAIDEFGYAIEGSEGPAHQPVFVIRAWASIGGQRRNGEPVRARSKKDGRLQAAARLLDALKG